MMRSKRTGETHSLADFLPAERRRIMDGANEVRREQMRAAEARRNVYRAWNEVCSGTREGAHVTGLHYVPENNELIVYADGSAWVAELSMMREIIRARMYRLGVDIAQIKVQLTKPGYTASTPSTKTSSSGPSRPAKKGPAPRHPLSESADRKLDATVAPIEDARLRDALKKAMKASLEHKITKDGRN